jgi:isocitrate dehydrogenase kinase/phosphatase
LSRTDLQLEVAEAIRAGFDRHYALFRYNAQQAKTRFEKGDWHGIRQLARERITFYDERVRETVALIEKEFRDLASDNAKNQALWNKVKRHYIELLAEHKQPELAETFFNSVSTKILHRAYFHNDFIFVRPAVATDYVDSDPPSYRVYYPRGVSELMHCLRQLIIDLGFSCPFEDAHRDLLWVANAIETQFKDLILSPDFQIQVLRSLFYRNKGSYLIGRIINDGEVIPFALPFLRNESGQVFIDCALFGIDRVEALFNFSRAYFMVDMETPSAWVRFLQSLMPAKPSSELYTMLGLHKQGKTLFYRDLLHHLRHSQDQFIIAPGIKGLVMLVFTLPSFPYVFKIIKDKRRKDMTREFIQGRYQLVKLHDRVGRMADTWEYSDVPFPKTRLTSELVQELRDMAPSILEEDGDNVIIKHLYIERRMIPLNIFLEQTTDSERESAVIEYGSAIKDMVAANIFPGDMLYKNFGMTRSGRVVFYDYDEVQYLTDCVFREVPEPRTPEDEMASEPWYPVGPNDVFPEEFATFLLGQSRLREPFLKNHADLLQASYWRQKQARVKQGLLEDVFPYPETLRFSNVHHSSIHA